MCLALKLFSFSRAHCSFFAFSDCDEFGAALSPCFGTSQAFCALDESALVPLYSDDSGGVGRREGPPVLLLLFNNPSTDLSAGIPNGEAPEMRAIMKEQKGES
jgi:hypothetical protein